MEKCGFHTTFFFGIWHHKTTSNWYLILQKMIKILCTCIDLMLKYPRSAKRASVPVIQEKSYQFNE
jgi:hypothetical protein